MDHPSAEAINGDGLKCVEARGAATFITRRIYHDVNGIERVWDSRRHRKRLGRSAAESRGHWLWSPGDLNWWIGGVFAIGASLFALGSVLLLAPALASAWSIGASGINLIYFLGSIPFTTSAYLQLYQSANPPNLPNLPGIVAASPRRFFGWRPRDIGWLSSALQFIGTLLFNLNTFDAMSPALTWLQQDLAVWTPDILGSILFLASGYLAFIEVCHAYGAWKPASLSWWITTINLLGCLGFMAAAVFTITLPGPGHPELTTLATAFTLQGALCFLLGAFLMLPETSS